MSPEIGGNRSKTPLIWPWRPCEPRAVCSPPIWHRSRAGVMWGRGLASLGEPGSCRQGPWAASTALRSPLLDHSAPPWFLNCPGALLMNPLFALPSRELSLFLPPKNNDRRGAQIALDCPLLGLSLRPCPLSPAMLRGPEEPGVRSPSFPLGGMLPPQGSLLLRALGRQQLLIAFVAARPRRALDSALPARLCPPPRNGPQA